MFQIRNVTYKDILNIKTVDIGSQEVMTFFGESGSGKTTLMKLLNQLISFDEGDILYNGRSVLDYDPIELRRQVVMLAQTPAVFAGNIRDNLLIGMKFSEKEPANDSTLVDALKMVRLHKDLDGGVDSLSGGEKQRLAFARVILMDAPVYLLDEPTSALDDDTESLVMDRFFDYARENGKTVVMVTHSKKLAEEHSDKMILMKDINERVVRP
ncbi:putative ABC transport system ATP-binding protein [Scopulibacillus darangshiensis]|uniref:Putative ABC transport system ATP-binding protein n=1 Tax=Scopulibacillus darangshiensis TaxID=442528 RepID=A0A4R2NNR5_9BACL|nr:ABC transporter ATP-binding protein [Scopulibacillus darangshiensis]TCP23413.1 putative ABC transport system ATP-binding protein [Scopulibacillus darangshiensis]